MDDMNDLRSRARGHRCNEQIWVVVVWKTHGCKLKALDAMNNSRLSMTWATLGLMLKPLEVMNNSRLWSTWMTLSRELRSLDAMNNVELLMTWKTLGCELSALDSMNRSRLCMTWKTLGRELRALDVMTNSGWRTISHTLRNHKMQQKMNFAHAWSPKCSYAPTPLDFYLQIFV